MLCVALPMRTMEKVAPAKLLPSVTVMVAPTMARVADSCEMVGRVARAPLELKRYGGEKISPSKWSFARSLRRISVENSRATNPVRTTNPSCHPERQDTCLLHRRRRDRKAHV